MNPIYPNDGALALAGLVQTGLAGSKLHLYKQGLVLGQTTTKDELDAVECDYDGYTPGGITITAWLAALLLAGGGAEIQSGTKQFVYIDGLTHVTNLAGGWYLTLAGGGLFAAGAFQNPVNFQANGQGVNLDLALDYGTP
jgi:hypothetical protein